MTQQSDDIVAACFGQTTIDMAMLLSATLEQPMNIYFSPTVIVFTRTDGTIYQHWIDGSHPIQLQRQPRYNEGLRAATFLCYNGVFVITGYLY